MNTSNVTNEYVLSVALHAPGARIQSLIPCASYEDAVSLKLGVERANALDTYRQCEICIVMWSVTQGKRVAIPMSQVREHAKQAWLDMYPGSTITQEAD